MLTGTTRREAYRLLCDFGLLAIIVRFLSDVREPIGLFAAVSEPTISFGLALAATVMDVRDGRLLEEDEIRRASSAMRKALRISNDEAEMLEGSLAFGYLLTPANDAALRVATLKRFLARPTAPQAQTLMASLGRIGIMYGRVQLVLERLNDLKKTDVAPPSLITGDDLTAAGLQPGPLFKRILDQVYDEQLEGHISSSEQALELALRLANGE